MLWRDGALPPDAPNFSLELSDDLLGYGYSLLLQGMRFADLGGEPQLARAAFEVAAESLEAVVAKGERNAEQDFHRLMAAGAYHLGRFSARAYSLLHRDIATANLSVVEASLAKLMLRDIDGLARDVENWFREGADTDEALVGALGEAGGDQEASLGNERLVEVMSTVVQGNFMAAMGIAMLAFERGEEILIEQAKNRLTHGLQATAELSLVTQWWCHRLAIQLLEGLWDTSFHHILPRTGPSGADTGEWAQLRRLFISSLYRRSKAEVELWPSQLGAASRVLEFDSNLVLSLPTSAGKTRIAEMCILACLAPPCQYDLRHLPLRDQ